MLHRAHVETPQKAPGRGPKAPGRVSGYFDPNFPLGEHSRWALPTASLRRLMPHQQTLLRHQICLGRGGLKKPEQFFSWKTSQVHQYVDVF